MFITNAPRDVSRQLGERLRSLRLHRNITQSDLAKSAGVSRPTLGALETAGKGSLGTFVRVLYALGRERELDSLLLADPPRTLDEAAAPTTRQRARS